MAQRFEFQITSRDNKKRLDDFLFAQFPHLSRMYLRELVRDEKCQVNGRFENRGFVLRHNDFIEIEVDRDRQTSLQPESIPIEIVFEDAELLVVNKPAGMLVHPTVRIRSGTLLNALAHHLNSDLQTGADVPPAEDNDFVRAGLVHRLDKGTSGLVVVAKTRRSHRILCAHFQRKLVEKRYYAVVEGSVSDDQGIIDAPIGRYAEIRLWNIKEDGKRAVSRFWVRKRSASQTLLELEPVTGRTNQLRIHLAHIGHPILGDDKYGGQTAPRMFLHAFKLRFWHPDGGRQLEFETPLPESMQTEKRAD